MGPGYTIDDEPVNDTVRPRRRGDGPDQRQPNSVGSQFFIVLDDAAATALASANTYPIIGHVTEGMDVVDAIAAMPNAGDQDGNAAIQDVPMTDVYGRQPVTPSDKEPP